MKILHLAKANITKNRSHTISLFIIIMVTSMLLTIGLSTALGIHEDFRKSIDKLNSLHSAFVMTEEMYQDSFEDLIKNDDRVSEYNIEPMVYPGRVTMDYGGIADLNAMILNLDTADTISFPIIKEEDLSVPQDKAIYLPSYSKMLGYNLGDNFIITYKNKPLTFVVAGFFETNELSLSNGYGIKFFVPEENFTQLTQQIGRSVWIAVRLHDPYDSASFNRDFRSKIDVELSSMGEGSLAIGFMELTNSIIGTQVMSGIVIGFAFLIALISLMAIRFRVTNSINDNIHNIGVLKAAGYTSRQIIASFLLEYGLIAVPASLLGIFVTIPLFAPFRTMMTSMTGISWTLGINFGISLIAALLIALLLLIMVLLSCSRIKKLPPVEALRGGISTLNFRRNFFPLHKGMSGVHIRLGLKNIFAYGKLYTMIGLIITGISLAMTFMIATYQNLVLDNTAIIKMVGIEIADVALTVTRHTDADALALEIEAMPEVRKTSMLDWVSVRIEGEDIAGFISNDYSPMETMSAHEGRFPLWDNEIAMPERLAKSFHKAIGDTVKVKANGVTQEFIISGFYSTTNNGGAVCALTLDGYQRLNSNQKRVGINVYLNDDVTVEDFSKILEERFGVINVYQVDENDKYAAAKARAEEKISTYLQQYNINSVEYAAIFNGEIILSGSSDRYQIEKITNYRELIKAQTGIFASSISLMTQLIAVISLVIISIILFMTIKSIIAKRRQELGTLKAGGFTTKELALQLSLSFIPAAALGVLIGCFSGGLLLNPAYKIIFSSMGVKNVIFTINPFIITLAGLLIILVTFGIAMISAMKIKHISVCELLHE